MDTDWGAFTLGYAKSYDACLVSPSPENPATKIGVRDDYEGGWIWATPEGALSFRASEGFAKAFPGRDPNEFAVYRLELPTDWGTDVTPEPHPSDGVHRLLHDARIIERVP